MADRDVDNTAEEARDDDARQGQDELDTQAAQPDLTGSAPEQNEPELDEETEAEAADADLASEAQVAESESDPDEVTPEELPEGESQALAKTDTPEESEESEEADVTQENAASEGTDESGPIARDEDDVDADTDTLEAPEGIGQPEVTTERVIEAVLFASDAPLPLSKIVSILGVGSARDVRNHIKTLNERYAQTNASFRIEQIASGYQMLSLPVYNNWIRRLKQSKQDSRLSQAAMETLAVVAYKQPVIRADIEAIRGVSAGEMLNRLREVGLIKIVGRAEDVGRPMLYGTTKRFLEVFGLSGLEDLPPVEELQPGQQ